MIIKLFIEAICLTLILGQTSQNLETYLTELEGTLKTMVKTIEDQFKNRCSTSSCEICSYLSCSDQEPKNEVCLSDFPDEERCGNTAGRFGSYENTVVQLGITNTSYGTQNKVSIQDQKVRELICGFSNLDQMFKDTYKKYNQTIGWQYFGTYNGIYRGYPFKPMCQIYDVRNRPWFVSASSGRKNVMIIIDVSGSMSNQDAGTQTRMKTAQDAIMQVVSSLGFMDYVGVVSFATSASYYKDVLVPATKENIKEILTYIQTLVTRDQTNYYEAFTTAFDILDKSFTNEISDYQTTTTTIQFMTDGIITVGGTANDVYSLIQTRNALYKSLIFTYSIGQDSVEEVTKTISCQNSGIYKKVAQEEDLNLILSTFFKILASAVTNEPKPVYTEIFLDASGLGQTSAISMAVFDRTQTTPVFLGVVGMDLLVDKLKSFSGYENILQTLIVKNKQKGRIVLSECELENWRDDLMKCGVSNCPSLEIIQPCPQNFKDWPFCGTQEDVKYTGEFEIQCCVISSILKLGFLLLINFLLM